MSDEQRPVLPLPRPVDTTQALAEALALLASQGIHLPVLIGGVALSVYGVERYTRDVDFALTLSAVPSPSSAPELIRTSTSVHESWWISESRTSSPANHL